MNYSTNFKISALSMISKTALLLLVLSILLLSFNSTTVQAALYKSIDADGNVSYSQNPPKTGNYKKIKVKKFKPVPADASTRSQNAKKSFEKGAQTRKENDLVKIELEKTNKIKQENCKIAKKNLRLFTLYRKLKNEKGEYYRVTDTEKAQRIKTAKGNIKQFCN